MHYGFMPNDNVEVALPEPDSVLAVQMADPPSSHMLRRNLLQGLGLPPGGSDEDDNEDSDEDEKRQEASKPIDSMALSEDGLAALVLQEEPPAAVRGGAAGALHSGGSGEPREVGETKLLCTLRIRRMSEHRLVQCAQHGSVRQCCTTPAEQSAVEAAVWEDYEALAQAASASIEQQGMASTHAVGQDGAGVLSGHQNMGAAARYRRNSLRFLAGLRERAAAKRTALVGAP